MRPIRTFRRIAPWLALGCVVACAALYLLASWIPRQFDPPRLSQSDKEYWARVFVSDIMRFQNMGQQAKPYDWAMAEADLNNYLASMDQIVFDMRPSGKRGDVQKVLETAGVSAPMVRLYEDRMTVMLRSHEHGKVLSADIQIGVTPEGSIQGRLLGTRVGLLPVPDFAVEARLREFKDLLQERLDKIHVTKKTDELPKAAGPVFRVNFNIIEEILATMILAIDGQPMEARLRLPNDKRVRIADIQFRPGRLSFRVVPDAGPASDDSDDP